MANIHLDFETRSLIDVTEVGPWKYSTDPSTSVLCLCFTIDDEKVLTITKDDFDNYFYDFIGDGGFTTPNIEQAKALALDKTNIFKAHNSMFEFCMWNNVLHKRLGFPNMWDLKRWDCTAAKAASHALPRSLAKCAKALHLSEEKDESGKKTMLQLSRPKNPSKKDPTRWVNDPAKLETLYSYCDQDVIVEREIDKAIPDLGKTEKAIWELDQKINLRGVQIDTEVLDTAIKFTSEYKTRLNLELQDLTSGAVMAATEVKKLAEYLHNHVEPGALPSLNAAIIKDYLKTCENEQVRRILEIRQQAGKSSTAKLDKIKQRLGEDERVRDILVYHGASTGRWAGSGIQVQNFPKGSDDYNADIIIQTLKLHDLEAFEMLYPNVIDAISAALRGFIIAKPGHDLIAADFAQIEARVLMVLAGAQRGIDEFKSGADIYLRLAEEIYKRPLDKKKNKVERQLGKMGVLGCGFQMGPERFIGHVKNMVGLDISYDTAQSVVQTYRTTYPEVVKFWYAQERAAILATRNPGRLVQEGPIAWKVQGFFLYCKLPSGRCLAYAEPLIKEVTTKWGSVKESLTFMGVNSLTKRWERQHTYGGMITENIVQATARDLMCNGMLQLEAKGYPICMTVHDEVVAEVPIGFGSVKEFEDTLSAVPSWAKDYPVIAEGWRGIRYKK